MSSPSPSGSPRWDSPWDHRNSGFVGPSQLQHWRQQQQLLQQQHEQQHSLEQQREQEHKAQAHETQAEPSAPPDSTPLHAQSQQQPVLFRTTSRPESPMSMQSPTSPPAHTHTRTTSAFSFFKRPNHSSTLSTSSLSPLKQEGHADEFGQQPATPSSSKSPPASATNGERPASANLEQSVATSPRPVHVRSATMSQPGDAPLPPLHPEIRSIVQLNIAHGRKIYFNGPLIRHLERQPDGQRPVKDEDWRDVWAQLGGTTLSLWDMKEIQEASKQGRQVPPSYINVTDAVSTKSLCRRVMRYRLLMRTIGVPPPSSLCKCWDL